MRELREDGFDVVLGTESMWLSACALGAEAYIPGLGNAFPEICGEMWQQGMKNDIKACRQTQFEVNKLRDVMYLARSTQLAVYAMLEIRGVLRAYPRSPFVPATDAEKEKICKALEGLGVLSTTAR
jgi:dihydrodipicolinate synthase/N-acetylneuraminate lyase